VSSNQYIVDLPISCQNARSCVTLLHTNQLTHCCSNHPSPAGKDEVQHTNIFSVGATAPALKENFQTRFSFHIFCVCILYTVKRALARQSAHFFCYQKPEQNAADWPSGTNSAALLLLGGASGWAKKLARILPEILGLLPPACQTRAE
jgi:hypothetical protein